MNEEPQQTEAPITLKDLVYLATYCTTALKRLGYIRENQLTQWGIDFGDVCEERGLLGSTTQTQDGRQGILINPKIDKSELLRTISHEAVHLIQFMKGDAKRTEVQDTIEWKGVQHKILPPGDPEYDNQPWEEEAFRIGPLVVAELNRVFTTEMAQFQ